MALSCCFWEAHFSLLSSQSNVYGLTSFPLPNGGSKVLVAPLKDNVLCLEYVKERGKLKPIAKEVQFIYSNPDDAELASISAFTKQPGSTGLVVGITFTKDDGNNPPSYYFNIYYPWGKDTDFNLDSDSHGWTYIEHQLDFIPYYLCHTDVVQDGHLETVFLLTGGDSKVHLYKEGKESSSRFSECPIDNIFPEFQDLPSIGLWLACQLLPNDRRLTAIGCQNGYLRISLVSCKADSVDIVRTWDLQHDSAITCLKLFKDQAPVPRPSFLPQDPQDDPGDDQWHLLVASALEVAVIYRNVTVSGFHIQRVLVGSDCFDCTLCACVADVDWDANNEILLGTYGQELLCYKYFPDEHVIQQDDEPDPRGEARHQEIDPATREVKEEGEDRKETGTPSSVDDTPRGAYRLVWQRSFSHPLLAMKYVDLMSDGLYELIVLSLKGVHILQHDLEEAAGICEQRLVSVVLPPPSLSADDTR